MIVLNSLLGVVEPPGSEKDANSSLERLGPLERKSSWEDDSPMRGEHLQSSPCGGRKALLYTQVYLHIPGLREKGSTSAEQSSMQDDGHAKTPSPHPKGLSAEIFKDAQDAEMKKKKAWGNKKSPVLTMPQRTEHPIMGLRSQKNFITANATEAITLVLKKPLRACVDVWKGDKFLTDHSGLDQKYLKKKDFGALPRYLVKRNEEAQRAKEESDKCIKETLGQKGPKRVSKKRGRMAVETIPWKLYREKLETQMNQLEHDISILEKHPVIYIANK
ncbi:UNVERIFIED_CONTAM: hypothetical protein K2H54_038075 [Gekko kuhli]